MYSTPPAYSVPVAHRKHTSIGSLLGEAFRLYKGNFRLYLVLALLATVPSLFMALLVSGTQSGGAMAMISQMLTPRSMDLDLLPMLIVSALVQGLGSLIGLGTMTLVVRDSYAGMQPTVGSVFSRLMPHLPSLIVFSILISASMLVPLVLSLVIFSPGIFLLVGLPILIFVTIRLMFWAQVIVLEARPLGEVWARCLQLTRGAFWRLLILMICLGICVGIMGALLGMLLTPLMLSSLEDLTLFTIASSLLGAVLLPISHISQVVLYFGQRDEEQTVL